MYDVISIGAATVDIFVKSNSVIDDGKFQKFAASSKNEIDSSLICSGGGGTNSSVTFARLGLNSAPLSLLGSDHLSNYILDDLKSDKISSNLLIRPKDENTDFSVIFIDNVGGRSVFTNRGTTSLTTNNVPWSKICKTKWLYITSLEGNLDLLETIIGHAFENNIKIAINPGNREIAKPRRLLSLLKHCNYLLLNKTESETLSGHSTKTASFWNFYLKVCPIVAITNGREGAHILTCEQHLFSPILNVKPIDETGAGDAFGSASLSALILGKDIQTALEWGIKNSASVVAHLGAKPGILTTSQIK
ncbi:MAG: carbohydrate kinase family protein [Candidatus Shapirobacteria bacterium]